MSSGAPLPSGPPSLRHCALNMTRTGPFIGVLRIMCEDLCCTIYTFSPLCSCVFAPYERHG